jgi:hypothetical protein
MTEQQPKRTNWDALETAINDAERQWKEPVLATGLGSLVKAFILALIPLAAVYGFDIGGEKADAWVTFVVALIPLVVMARALFVIRGRVYSPATYERDVQAALYREPPKDEG